MAALKLNNADFKLTLSNRFKDLPTTDINEWNDQIISIIIQSATEKAGKKTKDQYKELPIEIKNLLEKRRTWKTESTVSHIEYTELCKTIRRTHKGQKYSTDTNYDREKPKSE